ncbi:MAG: cyanophycinase [Gemmataceae bacterium]
MMITFLLLFAAAPPPPAGSVFAVGGGRMPDAVRQAFLDLAGGKAARLVVIPTASDYADTEPDTFLAPWRAAKPASLQLLHSRRRADADKLAALLERATGVWISGGDQSRLADSYGGTAVEEALRRVVGRGGVVGGTSAGAAILSRVMITGGRREPTLGTGFGLLGGVVVDQHFLARDRLDRLLHALGRHPALLGLGIDESTAAVVRGDEVRVVGESYVLLITPGPRFRVLKAGDRARLGR